MEKIVREGDLIETEDGQTYVFDKRGMQDMGNGTLPTDEFTAWETDEQFESEWDLIAARKFKKNRQINLPWQKARRFRCHDTGDIYNIKQKSFA
jgi:hypothetical protein